jgi:hypothetical protein
MPKGTRTAYAGDAGLFKEVKLNRGRAMASASQDTWWIKEVIHRQSTADGTTTDIMVTNPRGLGGEPLYGAETPTPNAN